MKIITKTGDDGTTALYMGGRVPKTDARVVTTGKIDTFHGSLGLIHKYLNGDRCCEEIKEWLIKIQKQLSFLMGEIMVTDDNKETYRSRFPHIESRDIQEMENLSDGMLASIKEFGGDMTEWKWHGESGPLVAQIDFSVKLCREAEIEVLMLKERFEVEIREELHKYLNRLSDFLFIIGRYLEANGN